MPDSAGAETSANHATVGTVENVDPERTLTRLRADVAQTQRVLDELVEGQARADVKAAEVAAGYKAKQAEVDKMITAAKSAVKDAETALKAEGN